LKNFIKKLLKIFSYKERLVFFFISFLLLITGSVEVFGIASLSPFLKVATSESQYLDNNSFLYKIYSFIGFLDYHSFVTFLGLVTIFLLISSSLLTMISNWIFIHYTHYIGYNLSSRLFLYYLNKELTFFLLNEKNFLIKKINYDVDIVVGHILVPILFLFSRIISIIFIFIFLLFFNPYVTCYLFISYFLFYFLFFSFIKKKIYTNSIIISENQERKVKILDEVISGIKEVILANKKIFFYNKFFHANKLYQTKYANFSALTQVPKGIIEIISIIIILIIFIIFLKLYNNNLSEIIPIIAIYALAGFKIIPSLQTIFQNLSYIKGSMFNFNLIIDDLVLSKSNKIQSSENNYNKILIFQNKITIDKVSYSYPSENFSILKNLSLEIKKNNLVSIIGPNGSGKSTIIHIILGLLHPTKGAVLIDDQKLDSKDKLISWQKNIGCVSQNIFLFNDTILNNIIFGLDARNINFEDIDKAIKFSNLNEFIDSLPKGLDTFIGDNGMNLSGGQRQKIAIARCLVKKPNVIVFDEATSALDSESEKNINDLIFKLRGSKTIINVAHKIESVKDSDLVYYIENGSVIFQGLYREVASKIEIMKNYMKKNTQVSETKL